MRFLSAQYGIPQSICYEIVLNTLKKGKHVFFTNWAQRGWEHVWYALETNWTNIRAKIYLKRTVGIDEIWDSS